MKTRSHCYAVSRNLGIVIKQFICVIFIVMFLGCTKEQNEEASEELAKDMETPSVVSVSPANDATAVSTETGLTVVFSEKLDSTTINTSSFTLRRGASVVYGTVSYEGTTAIFIPASELEGYTMYTGTIKAGVKDLAGNLTSTDYLWKFTTGEAKDTKAPTVISMIPGANAISVPVTSIISATFNEGIKSETITASSFLLKKGTMIIEGTMSISGNSVSFTPSSSLSANSLYTVTITREVRDAAGNPMIADYSWSFTTAAPVDATAPVITSILPVADATNIPTSIKPSVTFSEPIDQATITATTFLLKREGVIVEGTISVNGATATLTPATALASNSTYSVTVTTGVKDIAGNPLAEVRTWSFTTSTQADVTAPTITSVLPLANATNIQTSINPSVNFSEAIDPATVNSSTFLLKKDGVNVSGNVSVNGTTATFTPANVLSANTTYSVTVTTGVKDLAGNPLAAVRTWSFTTSAQADATAPTITSVLPLANATNIQTSIKPSVNFSEAIDPATVNSSTFQLKKDGVNVSGTGSVNGTTATFTPANVLSANTTYSVTVTTGVKDIAGNPLATAKTWSFTTAGLADVTAPQVSSSTPANNSTAVQTTVKPTVTFSEPVDPATINSATIILKQGSTIVNGTISLSGNTVTFSPGSQLTANTAYTLTVTTGIKDVSGNALAAPFSSTFTTAAAVPTAKSFANDVVPVLNTCNQCHKHNWTPSTTPSTFHSNLVSSGHINLSTPTSGKIYTKLNGGHPSSGVTAEQKATVLTWIKEGSKNN